MQKGEDVRPGVTVKRHQKKKWDSPAIGDTTEREGGRNSLRTGEGGGTLEVRRKWERGQTRKEKVISVTGEQESKVQ